MTSQECYSRVGSLIVLVVMFQVCVARIPTVQKENKRRWQHALTGHFLVQISYLLTRHQAVLLLLAASVGIFVWRSVWKHHFYVAFGPLLRPSELEGGTQYMPGAFYFLLGAALTVWIVDDWTLSRYAVECLALADPMASWIGSTIPSPMVNEGSSLSGCVACFVTAFVVGFFMLDPSDRSFGTLSLGALACTVAEALPFGNDNLSIPIVTAVVIQKLSRR